MQQNIERSYSDVNSLREFSVSAISSEFNKYTAMIPKFQEYAANARDRFGNRKLFTEKTIKSDCGASALVLVSEHSGKSRLISMERCHNRFCPLCSYVEQKKDSQRVRYILEKAFQEEDTVLFSFGLSFPNCSGSELNDTIKRLNKAFKRFSNECFPEAVKDDIKIGTFRKLEVTLSEKHHKQMLAEGIEDYWNYPNLFNPHLHVLFHIRKSKYFGTPYYKTKMEYLDIWRRVSGRYDTLNIHLKAKDLSRADIKNGVIRDFSFYVSKPNQILTNQEVFDIMVSAIKGKQGYSLGGTLEQYALAYDSGDRLSKKESFNRMVEEENIIDVYTHIAYVKFNFDDDDGYYYCHEIKQMPVPLLLGDADIGRLYNCSHLLSYQMFLDTFILQGFMEGLSIDTLLHADYLKHIAS